MERARTRSLLLLAMLANGCAATPPASTSPPPTLTPTSAAVGTSAPAPSVQPTVKGIAGEPIQVAAFASLTVRFASAWKNHDSRLAGYRYAVIDLSVEAIGDGAIALALDSFGLIDVTGREYSPLAKGAGPALILPNSVAMGKTLAGKLTFEIPAGGNYSLRFRPSEVDIVALVDVTRAIAAIKPVPDPTAKPRASTKPTSAPAGGGSGSGNGGNASTSQTANAYIDSVLDLYGFTLRSRTLEMAFAEGCSTPGATVEECAATREAWAPRVAEVRRFISDHVAFMKSRPAATCFRDAYADDRALAQDYLAWVADWEPMGTVETSDARFQYIAWQDLDYRAEQLLEGMNAYFRDCR